MTLRAEFSLYCDGPPRYGCHKDLSGHETVGAAIDSGNSDGWRRIKGTSLHLCPYCARRTDRELSNM